LIHVNVDCQSQIPVSNIWLGGIYIHRLPNNVNCYVDAGYRTYDGLNYKRSTLVRGMIEKTYMSALDLGIGYAFFDNFSFSRNRFVEENRLFTNIQYRIKSEKNLLMFRNRNEWRINEKGVKNEARWRFQLVDEYKFSRVTSRLSYEYLLSSTKNEEHRFAAGMLLPFFKQRFHIFYAINRQNNIVKDNKVVNQHVVGLQLQWTNKK
jgi:hypothetical protein